MKQQLTAGNILSVPVKTQAERISVLFRWGQGKCMKLELSPCPAAEADFTADYPVPFAGETVEIESSPAFFMNLAAQFFKIWFHQMIAAFRRHTDKRTIAAA